MSVTFGGTSFSGEDLKWIAPLLGLLMTGVYYYIRIRNSKASGSKPPAPTNSIVITQHNSHPSIPPSTDFQQLPAVPPKEKNALSILFIDDDVKFKVVSILKGHGWSNTKIIRDVNSLESAEVAAADIFFVDIQGVGKALQFKDEGLGLVVALKKRHPTKKVVIYSAESGLNAFHAAFKVCDDRISKDADPYEFIQTVERLSE